MRSYLVLLVLACGVARGADVHCGASATGSGNGSDWNNQADFDTLSLTRGNTYFLADGTYTGKTLNTANSGSTRIIIKKAVESDHGSATGWTSTLGDGRATFSGGVNLLTDFYTISGQSRDEGDWSSQTAYKIKIPSITSNTAAFGSVSDDIILEYIEIGEDYGTTNLEAYGDLIYVGGFTEKASNWIIRRNYLHNGRTIGQINNVENFLWEYNFMGPNWEKTGIRHHSGDCTDVVIRYNMFRNSCQGNGAFDETANSCTAIVGFYGDGDGVQAYTGALIYGNVFWDQGDIDFTDAAVLMTGSHGSGPSLDTCSGCNIHNNTFVGMGKNNVMGDFGNASIRFEGANSGSVAHNNIWYDIGTIGMTVACGAATCSNNTFSGLTSGNFVSVGTQNFRLTGAIAGTSLSSPYNQDMDGVTRGADGTFDRGAFEFDEGGEPPPPPTGLTLDFDVTLTNGVIQ